jgi:signal transduction histidine kinase
MTYDARWHTPITAAGYLGLIGFMFILGMIFELSRERAFNQLQETLRRLEVSNEKLTHLNREKNEFLGIAAHDLKNPLSTIVGYADLLARQPDPAPRLAGQISASATRMQTLIKNLLDANAIEEGRFISKLERCDLSELARQSVEHNQISATRKEIALKLEAPPGLFAIADRNATVQVLDNLVSNAVKYSPPGTTIVISASQADGKVIVAVKDQGPGLSEEDQKKLFQKFTRLTARPTGGESSNGLGLSIVKRLAEAMNGTVGCHSALGQGATFFVKLPAAPSN